MIFIEPHHEDKIEARLIISYARENLSNELRYNDTINKVVIML